MRWLRRGLLAAWLIPAWVAFDYYRCHRTGRTFHL